MDSKNHMNPPITSTLCIESNPHKTSHLMELRKLVAKYIYKNTDSIDGNNIARYLFGRDRRERDKVAEFKELHSKHLLGFIEDETKRQFPNNKTLSGRKLAHDFLSLTDNVFPPGKRNLTKQAMINKLRARSKPKSKIGKAHTNDTRRAYFLHKDHEALDIAYQFDIHTVDLIKDLMLQSVYQIRFDLQRTLIYRKRYANEPSYNVAQLHAVLQENLLKIRTLYTTCVNMLQYPKIVFLPYLITYEKSLQAHTDTSFYVRRLFQIHAQFLEELEDDKSKTKKLLNDLDNYISNSNNTSSTGSDGNGQPGTSSPTGDTSSSTSSTPPSARDPDGPPLAIHG